jgi:hypothetical protein
MTTDLDCDRDQDALDWLLGRDTPAVRAAALQCLLGRPPDDPDVVAARAAAMRTDPIAGMLAAQLPDGWWATPGPGYSPKYLGTVWQLIFLDQLGADPADERVQRGCDYVLRWCPTTSGGFGVSGSKLETAPPPSRVIHCLNGNLLRALIGFGRLADPRVVAAADWAAASITEDGDVRYYASSTCGPHFACSANDRQPCAWGAVKELRGLARIPVRRRSAAVRTAITEGVAFLLSRDPADADYPMGYGNTRPNASWFKLGFPSGYVTDVLQVLEVLTELGHGDDARLDRAREWLRGQRRPDGRWVNRYAYNRKTTVDIEQQGKPSKWVTLRALSVLDDPAPGVRARSA